MRIEQKIKELGIKLPELSTPNAMYVPVKQLGNALFVSGQAPLVNGEPAYTGKVGEERTLEEAEKAAKLCTINMLTAVKEYLGDLDRVVNVVKVQAFVNSTVGFTQQHIVVNAASQLLYDVFGDAGRHARTAVGTNQLPLDITVEIEAIFEIEANK
ncbi:RidA family protein [Clostridium sporogenes]|jgi:enamine deaminase RidA (YjgF/YER057c/UK114 family)|uniref:RidA family protein n=1 Tax=Clostridium sporogenes TaxID=1509 RepID=UPI0005F0239F|nr:RidA family protein [Clostridium sporogenes]MCW6093171.1 RidA family protein [Clostridium sporogenes]NFL75093.1 RidA family protein [Clostridium sporogenes]